MTVALARVIQDLKQGRVTHLADYPWSQHLMDDAVVVDVSALYEQWMASSVPLSIYSAKAAPPWTSALLGYQAHNGNVVVMHLISAEVAELKDLRGEEYQWQPGDALDRMHTDTHQIDWERVRWVVGVAVYFGGTSHGLAVPTTGPVLNWQLAVYPDGEIADIRWVIIAPDLDDPHIFDNQQSVMLKALDLCNCVNVIVAEPANRPRAQRRQLSRMGVKLSEIHVRPISKSYQGNGTPLSQGVPLSSVRGHFSEFGPKYGKGLLFGKYEGRYWIPAHARGSAEHGERKQSYVVEP